MSELPEVFTSRYRDATRAGVNGDECVVCGKRTGAHRRRMWHVRMDAGLGVLLPIDDPAVEDGGHFPVGPECRKAFPADYVTRLDPID